MGLSNYRFTPVSPSLGLANLTPIRQSDSVLHTAKMHLRFVTEALIPSPFIRPNNTLGPLKLKQLLQFTYQGVVAKQQRS